MAVYKFWKDAIVRVLGDANIALTIEEIDNEICKNHYYKSTAKDVKGRKDTINGTLNRGDKERRFVKEKLSTELDKYKLSLVGQECYDNDSLRSPMTNVEVSESLRDIKPFANSENKQELKIGDLNVVEALASNYNIILHGAPGTGKTYLAQKIAEKMGATKKNGQFKMVQFHPSYDYTDFVEGLRPTDKNEAGEVVKDIHFVRTDGIFKEFCKKAVAVKPIITEELLKQAWDNLISGDISSFKSKIGKDLKVANKNENKITFFGEEKEEGNDVSWQRLLKLHKKYPSLESVETIEKIEDIKDPDKGIGGCDASKYWAVLYYLYKSIVPSFIFLIDEINRGDMSKIFGELFFSIDPGYRVKKGEENEAIMITTQYQNLIDKNGTDPFKDGFYIPDNVYIIGTMNDIDRSVESMDFAMRRRFQFIEVTAESRAEGMGLVKKNADGKITTTTEAYKRMTNLNNCISGKVEDGGIGLSSAYHIGGSYFLSEKKDDKGQRNPISSADGFKDLWNYRLEGLLREYLRGEEESIANEKLTKLENAFKQPDVYEYDKDGKLTVVEKKSEEAASQQNGDSPKNSTKAE